MGYIYLAIAIVAEVIATSAVKASDGFTKLVPSVIVVVGLGVGFLLFVVGVQNCADGHRLCHLVGAGDCADFGGGFFQVWAKH